MLPPVGLADLNRLMDDLELRRKSLWRSDAAMSSELRSGKHQRVTDVIAIADIGKMQTLSRAKALLQGEEICDGLAGMFEIRERVDDGNFASKLPSR